MFGGGGGGGVEVKQGITIKFYIILICRDRGSSYRLNRKYRAVDRKNTTEAMPMKIVPCRIPEAIQKYTTPILVSRRRCGGLS